MASRKEATVAAANAACSARSMPSLARCSSSKEAMERCSEACNSASSVDPDKVGVDVDVVVVLLLLLSATKGASILLVLLWLITCLTFWTNSSRRSTSAEMSLSRGCNPEACCPTD